MSTTNFFLIVFVSALNFYNLLFAENVYCTWDYTYLCRSYPNELNLCGSSGKFVGRCPADARMENLNFTQFLGFFNEKRSKVANGAIEGLKPAAKMNELHWCQELAAIAEHSVRLCNQNASFCPRTVRFPHAPIYTREHPAANNTKVFDLSTLNKWALSKKELINATLAVRDRKDAEAHANYLNDKNTHIGCAASRYTRSNNEHYILFACAFSHPAYFSKPYEEGLPASECPSGEISEDYAGLCKVHDKVLKKFSDIC